jgi:hypothetical protein
MNRRSAQISEVGSMGRVLEARSEGGDDLEQVRDGHIDLSAFHAGEVSRVQLRAVGEFLDRSSRSLRISLI